MSTPSSTQSSRRSFIKKSAAAGLGFTFLPAYLTSARTADNPLLPPSQRLNLGCIGVGGRASSVIPDLCSGGAATPVAFADVDFVSARNVAKNLEQFPEAKTYNDFRVMYDQMGDDIDAVSVVTPDHTHFVAAIQAMALGKHVYVEKPLTHTFEEAAMLMRAEEEFGVVTQMGNQGHTSSGAEQFKQLVAAGVVDDVIKIDAWKQGGLWFMEKDTRITDFPTGDVMPQSLQSWDLWCGPKGVKPYSSMLHPFNWRGFYQYGCGMFGDWGCHIIDFVHHYLNLGLPLDETMLSEVLHEHGYATAAIGKWHLGDFPKFWPNQRGFDYWYGMYSGGMSYWGEPKKTSPPMDRILRNGEPVPFDEISYLTDDFTDEAIGFIDREKENPFFIYLAYNAPHGPIHATADYLAETEHIEDGRRAAYAGLVVGLDAGVGRVVAKLKAEGLYENTLIIYYSDNGAMRSGASSAPYRGFKGMLFEGGIRVPFSVTWGDRFHQDTVIDEPVTALDIFPTVLNAAGINPGAKPNLEGVDLTPMLNGQETSLPAREIYWRVSGASGYAVRQGDYKLVHSIFKPEPFLFDLRNDPYERHNLAAEFPEKFDELENLYTAWNTDNVAPKWEDPHFANRDKEVEGRESYIRKAQAGETR
ncbi:sulfatase-like hydrolase/transferase [Opitutaceae bacterium]|nr:sulfatase-like hydrolase/transferase [Opitutaceae bacterium]